jgi:hypothetical protein
MNMQHSEPSPLAQHRLSMRPPAGTKEVAQWMIAAWAGYPNCQGQVSKIEHGRLPLDPNEQKNWARAYKLSVKAFVRLVDASRGWTVLPLWRFAQVDEQPKEPRVIVISNNPNAPAGTIVRAQA